MDELNRQHWGDAYGPCSSRYATGTLREPRIRVTITIAGVE